MSHPLERLLCPGPRVVAGLMSGTSLDGVDAAVVRLDGSGAALRLETLGFVSRPYDAELRAALAACAEVATSNVRLVSQLHARLGDVFADVALAALDAAGLGPGALDLVGSHGQTVQHVPVAEEVAGAPTRSTLQVGSPAVLAARLGTPVVADFRAGDVALGGQGAPLAPTLDGALFAHADETRVLLNLGGIANLTVLPPGGPPRSAFDTGPANMVLDALALRLTGRPYDESGALAAQGTPDNALVDDVLAAPFFRAAPPKSTGREDFGAPFVDWLVGRGPSSPADLLATAAAVTARSVAEAVRRFVDPAPARVIASGGGVHNPTLMGRLAEALAPVPLETTAAYGLDPDAKEAVLFALLAHEWANGVRTGLPAVTGASRPAFQGSLTLP
ncbi:anhydro-N-acetylmuramic acid kinase [Rubrivirga sp.]|uniref:anhydro-N-acetylmuramic acid kinase n=1 Tax=Rubrivirga sp. TaxID=1885344 RepID=UPI003B525C11